MTGLRVVAALAALLAVDALLWLLAGAAVYGLLSVVTP